MADKSKNTGTGGINIDGKVYTPDVGVPDAAGGAQGDYSSGDINVDKTTKDISKPTRETFAKYLSKTTLGTAGSSPHKNVYPVGAGDQTKVEEIKLKDTQGNPVSPGAQNNETKFAAGFNQTISSNNPAGIKRGLTTGTGQDGNTLLPSASTAADPGGNYVKFVTSTSDGKGLQEPIKAYTNTTIGPNLYDYDSNKVGISDGTLNQSPSGLREDIRIISTNSNVETDGGTSKNILGADNGQGDYTLTATEARALAGTTTAKNRFPIDITPSVVTLRDASGNPVSVTASQNNVTNASFFTKLVEEKEVGGKTVQVISVRELSSYTPALTSAASVNANKFEIKRGKTAGGTIDGDELLLTIAPEKNGVVTLTPAAQTYTDEVLKPNLRDYADYTAAKKTANLSGDAQQQNLYDLQKTTDLATDGGTSKNVLDPTKKIPFTTEAELVKTLTAMNFFPVDSPVIGPLDAKTLNLFKLDSSAVLAKTKNEKSFADIKIGSVVVGSKGKLINNNLPDGNTLLLTAVSPAATSGGPYVKFVAIDVNKQRQNLLGLQNPIRNYTVDTLSKNLYKPTDSDNKAIVDQQGSTGPDFFGPKQLHKPVSGPADAGTFDNIQSDPSKRAVTKEILFNRSVSEVKGENAPGGVGNVYKPAPVLPNELFNFTVDGYPRSVTVDQNVVVSDDQYVLPVADQVQLQSSYTEFATQDNLQIKRGKSPVDAPDGNTLLKDAAPPAKTGGPYVKPATSVSPPINTYVSKVLQKNRYNPIGRSQFVPSDTPGAEGKTQDGIDPSPGGQRFENISDKGAPEASFVGRTTLYAPSQLKFGESPQSMNNRAADGKKVEGFTFRRLTRIGTILQLRAAGEIISITGDQNDDPRSNLEQLAAALVPGLGQAGAGVPLSRELLNVTEIIKNLPDESTGAAGVNTIAQYEGELIDISRNFEGVVNTTLEKFSGFSSLGLLILAIALVAVIIVVIWGILGNLLSSSSALNRAEKHPDGVAGQNVNQILGLGSFKGRGMTGGTNFIADLVNAVTRVPSSGAVSLFGISPTYNREYSDAVYRGALAFFGLGASPPPLLAYPGQVVVTSRAIVRGTAQLVLAFADIGSAFATGNIFSAIFKLIDIIEVIRNSKVIKALNTFSQIGDRGPYTILSDLYEKPPSPETLTDQQKNGGAPTETSIQATKTTGLFGGVELYQQTTNEEFDLGVKISEIDSVVNFKEKHAIEDDAGDYNTEYIGISQVKNRLNDTSGNPTRALAWSTFRAPSLHVDVKSLGADVDLDGKYDAAKLQKNNDYNQVFSETGPRIDAESVIDFEDALDGEYMPFYFHDLRTNEIIGLHAFLLSLTDDYSANYESISGIGRAEPVRIYKDTQRKIGFSFMLAALDTNDFDHMWDKVNRLTMLAYPQYTSGKLYNGPSGITFEKPFTQQVAAAPMVRLRLGNLFRSNYSKFNIAKIFGIGSPNTKVYLTDDDQKNKANQAKDAEAKKKKALIDRIKAEVTKELEADRKRMYQIDYTFKLRNEGIYKTTLDKKLAEKYGIQPSEQKLPTSTSSKKEKNPRYVDNGDWYKVQKDDANGKLRFKIVNVYPQNNGDPPEYAEGIFEATSTATEAEKSKLKSPDGKKFFIPISGLDMDDDTKRKYVDAINAAVVADQRVKDAENQTQSSASTNEKVVKSIQEFMRAENNVIVRSFESTGGKGLAGFIDSMSFDWYDRVTWDTDIERKAPKMCKVTISFTPVHDIAPGLDTYGNNRAPIYPLGPYAYGTRKNGR